MAHGGASAPRRRQRPDHRDGPPGEGLRRPPHPRPVPDHQRAVSRGADQTHAFESAWVDLLAGRGGRGSPRGGNNVGGKARPQRTGPWVTTSPGGPKGRGTENNTPAAGLSGAED